MAFRGKWLGAALRLIAVGLGAALGLIGILGTGPTIWSPWPAAQVAPITAGAPLWTGIPLALLFYGLVAFVGRREGIGRTILAISLGLLVALSVGNAILRFEEGLSHQGWLHTVTVNLLSFAGLAYLGWRYRRLRVEPEPNGIRAWAMLLAIWLFWLGLPYLGEGI